MRNTLNALILAVSAALVMPVAAQAQEKQNFSFTYSGTVLTSPTETATNGTGTGPYDPRQGVLPAYTYEKGDLLTILFSGTIPFLDAFAPGADGLVRTRVSGIFPSTTNPEARVTSVEFDRLDGDRQVPGLFGVSGLDVVYDPTTREYSLQRNDPDRVYVGTVNLPDYQQFEDEMSNRRAELRNTPNVRDRQGWSNGIFRNGVLSFDGNPVSFSGPGGNGITGPLNIGGAFGGLKVSGGNPDPVPEPATMILFGGGAALLLHSRRKRKADRTEDAV